MKKNRTKIIFWIITRTGCSMKRDGEICKHFMKKVIGNFWYITRSWTDWQYSLIVISSETVWMNIWICSSKWWKSRGFNFDYHHRTEWVEIVRWDKKISCSNDIFWRITKHIVAIAKIEFVYDIEENDFILYISWCENLYGELWYLLTKVTRVGCEEQLFLINSVYNVYCCLLKCKQKHTWCWTDHVIGQKLMRQGHKFIR